MQFFFLFLCISFCIYISMPLFLKNFWFSLIVSAFENICFKAPESPLQVTPILNKSTSGWDVKTVAIFTVQLFVKPAVFGE